MSLQERTVILDLNFHTPGATRPGNLSETEIDADKDRVRLTKEIIRSPHYSRAAAIRNSTRVYVKRYALPSPFKNGTYLIPIGCLDVIYPILEKAKVEYNEAADRLKEDWPAIVEDAKKALRTQFNAEQYPSAERVRNAFGVDWQLLMFQTPDTASLGEVLYEQEKAKAEEKWREAEGQVSLALQQGLKKLVEHLLEKLRAITSGEKKVLKQAAVNHVNEFLDTFSNRNVLGDEALAKLVDQAKVILDGKDAAILKGEDMRGKITTELGKVTKELDNLITSTKRKFNFDD